MKTLVIDTATAACSVALFEGDVLAADLHEVVGRGHAERLVTMIAALPGEGRADRVLVDCGPGSFTGVRVGLAAALGLGIGWGVPVHGYTSTALIAAAAFADGDALDTLAVVLEGGHGEVFMQGFAANPLMATDELVSLRPADALARLGGRSAIGNGVRHMIALAPDAPAHERLPHAARAMLMPDAARSLPARPIYGRAPDAKLPPA